MRTRPLRIEAIDDEMAAVLRAKRPAEKIAMICAANRTARHLAAAGVRYQHPDWDEAQVRAEVLSRVCAQKHLRDIAGVLKISRDSVDREYIERQATILGVQDVWSEIACIDL